MELKENRRVVVHQVADTGLRNACRSGAIAVLPFSMFFKSSLGRNGISVSEERAGELLRDVQSDSEDDDLE